MINIPPQRGRDRPRRAPVDEEDVSIPYAPHPQEVTQAQPEFHLALLVEKEQQQRGVSVVDGFIQELMVRHKKCVFVVD